MTMAQRSAKEVHAILMDHTGGVETAIIRCDECCSSFEIHDSKYVSDASIAEAAEMAGWTFLGYGRWKCERHG